METTTAPPTRVLNAQDRCDRCGAQALVAVGIGTSELLFCGHHHRASADALQDYPVLADDRVQIR